MTADNKSPPFFLIRLLLLLTIYCCLKCVRSDVFGRYPEPNFYEHRETFWKIYKVFFEECGKWLLKNRLDVLQLADLPEMDFNLTAYDNNVHYQGKFGGTGFTAVNASQLIPIKNRSYAFMRTTYFISVCDFHMRNFTLILENYTLTVNGTRYSGRMSLRCYLNVWGLQLLGRFIPGCTVEVRRVHPLNFEQFNIESTGVDEYLARRIFEVFTDRLVGGFIGNITSFFFNPLAVNMRRFMYDKFDFCERLNKSREPQYEYDSIFNL